MKTKTLLAAAAAALALATSAGAQNAPPALNLTLAPHQSGGAVDKVGVTLKLQAPNAKPGEPFLRLPMVFASVETQRYEAAQIEVTDAKGAVPLVQKDDPADAANFLYFRRWQVARPTQGDVTVRYAATAAAFRPKLGSGPPFDLRPEAGGLNGAGVTFLALPDNSRPYSLGLDWDLGGDAGRLARRPEPGRRPAEAGRAGRTAGQHLLHGRPHEELSGGLERPAVRDLLAGDPAVRRAGRRGVDREGPHRHRHLLRRTGQALSRVLPPQPLSGHGRRRADQLVHVRLRRRSAPDRRRHAAPRRTRSSTTGPAA